MLTPSTRCWCRQRYRFAGADAITGGAATTFSSTTLTDSALTSAASSQGRHHHRFRQQHHSCCHSGNFQATCSTLPLVLSLLTVAVFLLLATQELARNCSYLDTALDVLVANGVGTIITGSTASPVPPHQRRHQLHLCN